jgi:hypothetical protein
VQQQPPGLPPGVRRLPQAPPALQHQALAAGAAAAAGGLLPPAAGGLPPPAAAPPQPPVGGGAGRMQAGPDSSAGRQAGQGMSQWDRPDPVSSRWDAPQQLGGQPPGPRPQQQAGGGLPTLNMIGLSARPGASIPAGQPPPGQQSRMFAVLPLQHGAVGGAGSNGAAAGQPPLARPPQPPPGGPLPDVGALLQKLNRITQVRRA